MDLSDPAALFSSFIISMVGVGLFMYGKRAGKGKSLGVGLALCVYPIFVHSVALMWLIAVGLVGSLAALAKWA